MNAFTPEQLQHISWSAHQIASEEIDNRGFSDPELVENLAQFLTIFRDDWASFDEADDDSESYERVIDRFFDCG